MVAAAYGLGRLLWAYGLGRPAAFCGGGDAMAVVLVCAQARLCTRARVAFLVAVASGNR
jgi:hypothetical protein